MSRLNRIKPLIKAMSDEERIETLEWVEENYCIKCGKELPDEDSDAPDHLCPFEGEDENEDDEEDDEDEEGEDDDD